MDSATAPAMVLGANVVAPPPTVGVTGGTGVAGEGLLLTLGNPGVVPPPPSLSGAGGGTGTSAGGAGAPGGTLLANNVVPPPPSVGGGANASGPGMGRRGAGLGAPVDPGTGIGNPNNAGSGAKAGAVISSRARLKSWTAYNRRLWIVSHVSLRWRQNWIGRRRWRHRTSAAERALAAP